jgi:hypothetical protein
MRNRPTLASGHRRFMPALRPQPGATDVENATLRYLMYVLLPAWFVPGVLDWWMHRRTRIEHTAGLRESLIHALMMAEVGAPVAMALLLEINAPVLALMFGSAAVHEATAFWDVRVAVDSDREVRPNEQHIHSFLESLPLTAVSTIACLHADQLRALLTTAPSGWRLRRKQRPLPAGYLAGVASAIGLFVALPYGEELIRCLRAARQPNV